MTGKVEDNGRPNNGGLGNNIDDLNPLDDSNQGLMAHENIALKQAVMPA